jgi:hypothetical protein
VTALSISASSTTPGSTLSYAAWGLPPGLSIDASSGQITGTPAAGSAGTEWYNPTVVVSDGTCVQSVTFWWHVGSPVTVQSPGDRGNRVGDGIMLQVQGDGSGTLTYTAAGLPVGLSIDTGTGLISGTIDATAADIGSFLTTLTVTNGTSQSSTTFTWTVNATGVLRLADPGAQTDDEGEAITPLEASAGLVYTGSGTPHYFAFGLPPGLSIDPATGEITGTVAVGASDYGPNSVTLVVTDGTLSDQRTFTWTVSGPLTLNAVADQTGTEGTSITPVTASPNYSGSGTLVFSATGLPAGLSIDASTGQISGTPAVGVSAVGTYWVTVFATDGTAVANTTFQWTLTK